MKKLKLFLCTFSLMLVLIVATSMVYADSTPEGTPISSAAQLFALSNSSGGYYLANDIDVSDYENKQITFFKGTLDGNGHAIKGYTIDDSTGVFGNGSNYSACLFEETSGAVFKDLKFEEVNVNVCIDKVYDYVRASLFNFAAKTSFSNIEINGKVNVESSFNSDFLQVSALTCEQQYYTEISEIKNNASINVRIGACKVGTVTVSAIGVPVSELKCSNIQNNGNITITAGEESQVSKFWISGLLRNNTSEDVSFANSSNTGKISVTNNGSKKASVYISGLSNGAEAFNKCYNTGSLTFKGNAGNLMLAGLSEGTSVSETTNITQCYNRGTIKATASNRSGNTPWLAGLIVELKPDGTISNSYNTGNITYSGNSKNYAVLAGITSNQREDSSIKFCYNTGTIKGSGKSDEASISDGFSWGKATRNYYTKGSAVFTGKVKASQAKKVSKITAKNCPKLSSKYWVYSKAKGRMILKNNKEN